MGSRKWYLGVAAPLWRIPRVRSNSMETTTIPRIDLNVSRIGLGTWAIGGWMWGGADDRESIRTIHAALAKGINLLDSAPVYGFGHSEEIVGQAITQLGCRDKVIIRSEERRVGKECRSRW